MEWSFAEGLVVCARTRGTENEIPNGGCFVLLETQDMNGGRLKLRFTSGVYGRR